MTWQSSSAAASHERTPPNQRLSLGILETMPDDLSYKGDYPPHAYLQQLARAYRFLDRYKGLVRTKRGLPGADFNDLEDSLWAFFQNCWHVKDWLKHDPTVREDLKRRLLLVAESSQPLKIAADLANGSKHFKLTNARTRARDRAIQLIEHFDGTMSTVHMIELADGSSVTALQAAEQAMDAWKSLFRESGLPFFADPEELRNERA